jgi:Type ISP C-terminal specificity domain
MLWDSERRDQGGAADLEREFLEVKRGRLPQVGQRFVYRFPLTDRAGLRVESDIATLFGSGENGGQLHGYLLGQADSLPHPDGTRNPGCKKVEPRKLTRVDTEDEKARKAGLAPKCILKADKEGGRIVVDSETTLSGIPSEAWEYRLGNRSALEWILDQYKESKPKDPTIREKFDTYRFKDYKEKVIDLLARVTRVSVETQRIVEEMKKAPR